MITNTKIYLIATLLFLSGCAASKKPNSTSASNATRTESTIAQTQTSGEGTSIETAIVVKNVSEEYRYVKRVCSECKFKKQILISRENGKKHYDALYFDKAGEEVIYYFDINSFYGKMF